MHGMGDEIYNYFGIALPIGAMVNYPNCYEYDSLR